MKVCLALFFRGENFTGMQGMEGIKNGGEAAGLAPSPFQGEGWDEGENTSGAQAGGKKIFTGMLGMQGIKNRGEAG
jgi:hypothetical protein